MRYYRPSREEINAAHKALAILCAPLTKTKTENENEMSTQNETALATRNEQEALAEVGHENMLATLSADEMQQILDATKATEMAFIEYTSLTELLTLKGSAAFFEQIGIPKAQTEAVKKANDGALPMPFYVTDAVTVRIRNKQAKLGEDPEKTVHIFQMESAEGLTYYPMCGVNSTRDRIAEGFAKNRLIGRVGRFGPLQLKQIQTGQPQPAIVFSPLPTFKPEWRNA